MKVLILMSTYNGHKYITKQIESILNQKLDIGTELSIRIRDDGSTDGTFDILQKYAADYPHRIQLLKGENVGWADSFLELLYNADEAEYYAFADQDDIWFEDKVQTAVDSLQTVTDVPALYCCSVTMVDNNINVLGEFAVNEKYTLIDTICKCRVLGCTQIFNKYLFDRIIKAKRIYGIPHDWWVMSVCLLLEGVIINDRYPHMYYRQQGENVYGGNQSMTKRLKKILGDQSHKRENISKCLLSCFPDNRNEFIKTLANYRGSTRNWFRLLFCNYYSGVGFSKSLFMRVYVLLRKA